MILVKHFKRHISKLLQQIFAFFNIYYPPKGFRTRIPTDNEKIKPGVVFMCDGSVQHGGLSDRLRGLLTVFKVARRNHLPFYIYWKDPFNLEDYLLPKDINWSISEDELAKEDKAYKIYYFRTKNETENSFGLKKLKLAMLRPRKQLQVFSNADDFQDDYPLLFRQLFTESDEFLSRLDSHKANLGRNYQSFSFRFLQLLGDFDDCISEPLSEEKSEKLIRKCSDELLKLISTMPSTCKALVASDSSRFLNYVRNLDDRIYIVGGKIAHVDLADNTRKSDDAWMKTFIDLYLLMGAEKINLLKTDKMYNSGFPRFASIISGHPFELHEF